MTQILKINSFPATSLNLNERKKSNHCCEDHFTVRANNTPVRFRSFNVNVISAHYFETLWFPGQYLPCLFSQVLPQQYYARLLKSEIGKNRKHDFGAIFKYDLISSFMLLFTKFFREAHFMSGFGTINVKFRHLKNVGQLPNERLFLFFWTMPLPAAYITFDTAL